MSTILDRLQYGYDRDSRRTWRRRALTTGEDDHYGYDRLSQVVQGARGNLNLNQSAVAGVPASEEGWDYDPTGNWRGYKVEADGAVSLDQTRVHDKGNRMTQVAGDPDPVLLDRVGRMVEMPPGATGDWNESLKLTWDAWSRITEVKSAGDDSVLGNYVYDGLMRRTTREVSGSTQHSYYSDAWKPLEERKDSASTASVQYFWGARHRDDLVRRDRDSGDSGTLDETRYVLMDYFSPASITDETGTVTERYAFSAFGIRRILAPDFTPRSTSECAFEFAFQGQFLDTESGLYNYGFRYYSPFLGRWTAKDPIGEFGGYNLYRMVRNGAVNKTDAFGLLNDCCENQKKPDFFGTKCCPEDMIKDAAGRDVCKVAEVGKTKPFGWAGNEDCWDRLFKLFNTNAFEASQPWTCCGGKPYRDWGAPFAPSMIADFYRRGFTPGHCDNGRWTPPVFGGNGQGEPTNIDASLGFGAFGGVILFGASMGDSGFHLYMAFGVGTPGPQGGIQLTGGAPSTGWGQGLNASGGLKGYGGSIPTSGGGGSVGVAFPGVSATKQYTW